jgi:hypothetical protein
MNRRRLPKSLKPFVAFILTLGVLSENPPAELRAQGGGCSPDTGCVITCTNAAQYCQSRGCAGGTCQYSPFFCDLLWPNKIVCGGGIE